LRLGTYIREIRGIALPGDLREEDYWKKLVADAASGLGGLDILVCNAGRQQARASILDISSEDFEATMKTNIHALVSKTKTPIHTSLW
jgi:NAD(P)-dependent dehydrogenase (short-subunit alcohol dehydrogenase family)